MAMSLREALDAIVSGTYTHDHAVELLNRAGTDENSANKVLEYLNHAESRRNGAKKEVMERLFHDVTLLSADHNTLYEKVLDHPDLEKAVTPRTPRVPTPLTPTRGAHDMKILDKSYQKYGAKPLREYEKDVEKALSLHRDREYLPKDYLDHIGSKEKFSDHVVFDADPRRGHDEIELAGDLKRDKKNIEKLLKNREDIEKRISETTDTRRHKDMQNKLKEIDKDLADYGKSSQRLAKDTISDLQDHLENVRDTHSTTLEAIDAHHDKLKKAVDDIKLTTANEIDLATVKNLGDAEVSFKIKGAGGAEREFTIKNGAVSETGVTGAIKLDPAKELREFQDKAKEVIGDHIDAKIDVIERGAEQHAEVIQKQISHLEEHQNFLIEKTKIGKAAEGTKKLPGKTSVGTKLAEEKGIIGEAKYAELGGVSKAMADVKANWHSGLGGKIKVALGAGFIADGARRTIKGASALMSGDPEKQAEAGWGDVLVGVPEAIGGGLLARLGGSKHAMGLGA